MEAGNYNDAFVYLVNRYNFQRWEHCTILTKSSAAEVYTGDDGLDSEELLSASYWDILDNEGYWILPPKNERIK